MPATLAAASSPAAGTAVTPEEAAAMLRAAFALFGRWGLSDAQGRILLGQPSPATYYRWKRGQVGGIPSDTIWRLGDLMGIHKALRYLFADAERGYAWIRRPSTDFGGRSALDRMLGGAPGDLAAIRAYLDAERGGW
jgi:hypothetical protein